VRFVVLYAQEPVFPCGGHVGDAMWWGGDNNLRAHSRQGRRMAPESTGMIEARNRFWSAVSRCGKAAAVLAGDEHEYHRLLVDDSTPVGVYPADDTNGDGVLDRYSPNPDFVNPTYQLTAGTAGAPYYARQHTPWTPQKLSSQTGYILFRTDGQRLAATFYSVTGQAVDHVADLMAVKRPAAQREAAPAR
jgi:hypothetical protein